MAKKLYQVLPEATEAEDDELLLLGTVDGTGPSRKIKKKNLVPNTLVEESLAIAYAVAL